MREKVSDLDTFEGKPCMYAWEVDDEGLYDDEDGDYYDLIFGRDPEELAGTTVTLDVFVVTDTEEGEDGEEYVANADFYGYWEYRFDETGEDYTVSDFIRA